MEPIIKHTGIGVPLRSSNVDTDQIIPAVYLKRVTKTGFDDALFANWRKDPEFILNQEPTSTVACWWRARTSVPVLPVSTPCGRCATTVSRSLSPPVLPIFSAAISGKQGLVTAQVAQDDIELIWKALEHEPGTEITVDLESKTVTVGALVVPFEIDDYVRWRLMEGLDDIGLTLQNLEAIEAYEAKRPSWMPRTQESKPRALTPRDIKLERWRLKQLPPSSFLYPKTWHTYECASPELPERHIY